MMTLFNIILGVLVAAVGVAILVARNLTEICQPNEALIFSGGRYRMGKKTVGYRVIQGGRGLRIPMLERVDRLDLTNMSIDISVKGAYSRGGIPLNVECVANVKVAGHEPVIGNAVERFLGRNRNQIAAVARETLEGNLRGVLATLTPEEVNEDRLKFAQSLLHEGDDDLKRLGLVLDTLKIQNVSDDVGYLDSIGRRKSAELQMASRIAEADNKAAAAERSAENQEVQKFAEIDARIEVAKAEAARRIGEAKAKRAAGVAEAQAEVAAQLARARAEVPVQEARIEKLRLQLTADRVRPAEARKEAEIAKARGEAADIVEEGKARAESLRQMVATFDDAGDSARQIVIAQKLTTLVDGLMSTVGDVPINKVSVIDARLNETAPDPAIAAATTSEKLKHTLGLDVPAMVRNLTGTTG